MKAKLFTLPLALLVFFLNAQLGFAQDNPPEPPPSAGGSGPIFSLKNPLPQLTNLGDILNILLTLAFFVAGLFMFFNLVVGGIQWINSGGDPKALDAARGRLTNSVIGLIVVVAAYAVALILEQVFGIKIVTGFSFG